MRATSHFYLVLVLSLGTLLATGLCSRAHSLCPLEKPVAILDCISEAYAARDSVLYRELFADDYRFFFGNDSTSWGMEKEFPAMKELFRSATALEIQFPDRGTTLPGEIANTWILRGVATLMKFDAVKDGKPQHYEVAGKGHILRVRQVMEPTPHFVIYSWWQPAE